jgi:hypothetical protein
VQQQQRVAAATCRTTAMAFSCSPPEHSLRGRNIQDRRVLNETRPVRVYLSRLNTVKSACRRRTTT